MFIKKRIIFSVLLAYSNVVIAQGIDPTHPDFSEPVSIPGMKLVWHDEFNKNGKPDPANWRYENGFVRNNELQWYQPANATCADGVLLITGKNEKQKNPGYEQGSSDWRKSRDSAYYSSSSIHTRGLHKWHYGTFLIRARIDTSKGAWPAIWTLGTVDEWPSNGEIDIMEFYRIKSVPTILANVAWGSGKPYVAVWDSEKTPLEHFLKTDSDWVKKFHTWRMDWTKDSINLFLDDELLNSTALNKALNADGKSAFIHPQYLLLNLALGGNGDDPAQSKFPIKYEVDYVRVYQGKK